MIEFFSTDPIVMSGDPLLGSIFSNLVLTLIIYASDGEYHTGMFNVYPLPFLLSHKAVQVTPFYHLALLIFLLGFA